MASNTRKIFNTDIAISITGNAGPDPDENKKVGLAYIGVAVLDKIYAYEIISDEKDRNSIRIDFTSRVLTILERVLTEIGCSTRN